MSLAITQLPFVKEKTNLTIKLPHLKCWPHLFLITMILLSSFGLIYVKDFNRRLYIKQQSLENSYKKQMVEHEKLLLEKSTWSTQRRVQLLANQKLGMVSPHAQTVVVTHS